MNASPTSSASPIFASPSSTPANANEHAKAPRTRRTFSYTRTDRHSQNPWEREWLASHAPAKHTFHRYDRRIKLCRLSGEPFLDRGDGLDLCSREVEQCLKTSTLYMSGATSSSSYSYVYENENQRESDSEVKGRPGPRERAIDIAARLADLRASANQATYDSTTGTADAEDDNNGVKKRESQAVNSLERANLLYPAATLIKDGIAEGRFALGAVGLVAGNGPGVPVEHANSWAKSL